MNPWQYSKLSVAATLKELDSNKKGLSPAEAEKRLSSAEPNSLRHPFSAWLKAGLHRQVTDIFFLILLVAELAAWYQGDGHVILAIGVAIALNIWANAAFLRRGGRFIQYLERLLRTPATIMRSSKQLQVDATELVTGDIVLLRQGETVPADLRLINTENLVIDEYNISSSSQHLSKSARVGQQSLALLGSKVVSGSGSGVTVATGQNTVLGSRVDSIEKTVSYTAGLAGQRLAVIKPRIGYAAPVVFLALIIFSLLTGVNKDNFLLFLIVLSVALVPNGLTTELALLQHITKAPIAWVVRCALSDIGAKLSLVSIGIVGDAIWHVPMPITVVQVVALDIVALLLPITALAGDKPQEFTRKVTARLLGFGILSAILVYANYLLFFWRNSTSPVYLDRGSSFYFHAAALSFAAIVLCRLVSLIFVRSDHRERFFTRHLWANTKLVGALALSIILILVTIYYQPLQYYFDNQPLNLTDWLTAIAVGIILFAAHLFQRHTRKHTRRAVVNLHKSLGLTSSIK